MATKFKRLVKHENELALVIDKSVLAELNINDSTELEISVKSDGIFIKIAGVVQVISDKNLERSAKKTLDKYAPVFERLSKT